MKLGFELHRKSLDQLPTNLKGALAATCAQRQAAVYKTYVVRSKGKDPNAFDELLASLWDDVCGQRLSEQEHIQLHNRAYRLLPRKSAKPDPYLGNVEYAVLSLLYCNRTLMTGETDDLIWAARQPFDSIHNFLTSLVGGTPQIDIREPDAGERFDAHLLTQAEHRRQERDLQEIERVAGNERNVILATIDKLRQRAENEAGSFLPT